MKGSYTQAPANPNGNKSGGKGDSASEYGLTSGSKVKCPLVNGSQTLMNEHSLQHVDYSSLIEN